VELVEAFIRTVEAFCSATGSWPAILSITPAMQSFNPEWPCRGSLEVRREITADVNSRLRAKCLAKHWAFLDLFSHVADPEGGILPTMKEDALHLGPGAIPALRSLLGGMSDAAVA
jgi:hypothetical protein